MTLNQIVDRIQSICLEHGQVGSFSQGLLSDFLADKTKRYAAAYLLKGDGTISLSGQASTLYFKLFLLDLVHIDEETKSNELDVQSDMVSVAQDLIAKMNTYQDWKLSTDNKLSLMSEQGEDFLAGCSLDFSVSVKFTQNVCQVP